MEYLKGIGFSGYRSIGTMPLLLYPFKKVNLFIGPNNSGKSNILRYIYINNGHQDYQRDSDYPDYDKTINLKSYFPVCDENVDKITYSMECPTLSKVVKSRLFYHDDENEIIWMRDVDIDEISEYVENNCSNIIGLNNDVYAKYGFGASLPNIAMQGAIRDFCRKCNCWEPVRPSFYIEADRDLNDYNHNTFLESGETIIESLDALVNNEPGETDSIKKRNNIENFISELIGCRIKLKITKKNRTISLIDVNEEEGRKERSIEQLGSGIHEIIYFAIVATIKTGCLICIDEPEIHMHPRLQRQFLDYLIKNTDNQYFIATHSSAFLNSDSPDISIFRTRLVDGFTQCDYCFTPSDYYDILDELGCRASDILQANSVIWVEGPSDRIYINYWIHGTADGEKLIEGVDYSIMFYGGRLLSHLTADEDERGLINLLKLNRNSFVVIDSDKKDENDDINNTKRRIKIEFGDKAWITDGREIENYLNAEAYAALIKDDAFGGADFVPKTGKYGNRLKKEDCSSFDKVAFAKKFVEKNSVVDYSILDLKEQIDSLVEFIKKANR